MDGALGPSEWSDGDSVSFPWSGNATGPVIQGGGSIGIKNNGTNLLIAISFNARTTNSTGSDGYTYFLYLLFDNDNDGNLENGEDGKAAKIAFTQSGPIAGPADFHYDGTTYLYDTVGDIDVGIGNTSPGSTGSFVWEFSTPLNSTDPQDFAWNLSPQRSLGLEVVFEEEHYINAVLSTTRWAYWEVDYSSTGLPAGSSSQGWTNLVSQQAPIADNTQPVIGAPVSSPSLPSPLDHVTIVFNVTDTGSGVKNATVYYTTDNWATTNQTTVTSYNATTYAATTVMPLFNTQTVVKYYLVAWDNAGNSARNDNAGSYYTFSIGPLPPGPIYSQAWFYALIILLLAVFMFTILYEKRKKNPVPTQDRP